jgi:Fe-S cluster biogenesis protein NfuA
MTSAATEISAIRRAVAVILRPLEADGGRFAFSVDAEQGSVRVEATFGCDDSCAMAPAELSRLLEDAVRRSTGQILRVEVVTHD